MFGLDSAMAWDWLLAMMVALLLVMIVVAGLQQWHRGNQ